MAIYQPTGSGIGTLLRMIREERSASPLVSPQAESGAPIRELVQEPVYGAESPGASREVNIKPEGVAPETAGRLEEKAPLGVSRVGPLAIGGEDVGAIPQPEIPQEPQFNIPGKGDVNPATGKAYAVNPGSGVWDDNYWANTVEPALKAGTFNQPEAQNIPSKTDINPDTGKPYGVNPEGVWDDNWYANTVEPQLRAGTFGQPQAQPQPQAQAPTLATSVTPKPDNWYIAPQEEPKGQVLGTQISANPMRDYAGPTTEEAAAALKLNEWTEANDPFKQIEKEEKEKFGYGGTAISPNEQQKIIDELKYKYLKQPTPTPTPAPRR